MIYTPLTKKAMQIAFDAHKNQTDKGGMPYIYHPIHIAEQMTDEKTTCIALLHDVFEDTDMNLEQLSDYGFDDEIKEALRIMIHDNSVSYMDYIKEIKKNPLASKVKIADLQHNSDLTRLNDVDAYVIARTEKYKVALEFLVS